MPRTSTASGHSRTHEPRTLSTTTQPYRSHGHWTDNAQGERPSPSDDQLVIDNLPLARSLAARYAGRGEDVSELEQVARVGLVLAARRYDPDRGTKFATYAVPTILGELKKHFRDRCWAVRIPRPYHDIYHAAHAAEERLTHKLGRAPTTLELATELGVDDMKLLQALDSGRAYNAFSLELPTGSDDTDLTIGDTLEHKETYGPYQLVEDRESVRDLLAQLPWREKQLLHLSFVEDRSQVEIADHLGLSQMHVSRLLGTLLQQLRAAINDGTPLHLPKPRE